ncbi:hypothetical protein HDV04_003183 [Boothiomyces sp. JEL0838]|nr:hypothetical protein HDV04_003183 [Boothiomyces sp. JEL0838]
MDTDEFEALEAEYYKPCPILAKFYDTKDSQFENLEEALAISLKRNLDALKSAIKADIDVQSGVLADFQSEFTDNLQQILTEFAEYLNSSFPSQMYRKETFDKMKNREEELKSRLELKNLGGPSVSRIRVTKEKKSPKKIAFDSSLDHIDIGQHSTQFVRKIHVQSKPKESNIHPRLRNHFLYRYLHPAPKPKSEKVAPWFNRPSTHTSNLFKSADFHQLWNQYKPGKATSPKKVRPLSRLQNYSSP